MASLGFRYFDTYFASIWYANIYWIRRSCCIIILEELYSDYQLFLLKHIALLFLHLYQQFQLFTLAGFILAESGASRRMMSLFQSAFCMDSGWYTDNCGYFEWFFYCNDWRIGCNNFSSWWTSISDA